MIWRTCRDGGPHKFEPRYDEIQVVGTIDGRFSMTAEELRRLMFRNVYVCDVCVTCGTIVRRDGQATPR
jgi:epoxyqueuosine reductase QueG